MGKALPFLLACLFTCSSALPQQVATKPPHTKIVRAYPPGTIDGKDHPEQIPDLMAYRLFFVQLMLSPSPTLDENRRYDAKLSRIGLSDFDRVVVQVAASNFQKRYAFFLQQYKTAPVDDAAIAQRDSIAQDTIQDLHMSLSANGWKRFRAFIQGEKRHMKRIPMPAMKMN